ncbi:MAG: pyridoxal phosphate-dependent decarboxylase family protein [Bryobacteraceae bacterium]
MNTPDMSPEEFRRFGHEIVDWIAGYLNDPRRYPVLPGVRPGELTAKLPAAPPERGEPMETLLEDFHKLILPATTHWNHPRFMAYFSVSAAAPGILGELLAAALNTNGMLWKSMPASTELEQVTLGWIREWMGLDASWFGMIHDTASTSTLHAIAAARVRADPAVRTHGASPGLILYTSEQAHSSVEKGALALGLGQENVRKIPVCSNFRMRPDRLAAAIDEDRRAGRRPFCVVATIGTTGTTSIDPVPEIAEIAARERVWLHVDAAYGGAAALLPELRRLLAGCERADSMVVNPHKWFFTPVDLSAFYTRHPDVLRQAFSLVPQYLETDEGPGAVDLMNYGVPLGRRFRALKLWFVLRYFGREGMAAIIRSHIEYAQRLARWIEADPRFEVVAPAPLSLVCFRYKGTNEQNRALLDRLNATGAVFLSPNVIDGVYMIRAAIGNIRTMAEDVEAVWDLIRRTAEELFDR